MRVSGFSASGVSWTRSFVDRTSLRYTLTLSPIASEAGAQEDPAAGGAIHIEFPGRATQRPIDFSMNRVKLFVRTTAANLGNRCRSGQTKLRRVVVHADLRETRFSGGSLRRGKPWQQQLPAVWRLHDPGYSHCHRVCASGRFSKKEYGDLRYQRQHRHVGQL